MDHTIPAEDLEFLREVDRLGRSGMTQTGIAKALGLKSAGALQHRVNRRGCRLTPLNEVRLTLTGERLADLLEEQEAGA